VSLLSNNYHFWHLYWRACTKGVGAVGLPASAAKALTEQSVHYDLKHLSVVLDVLFPCVQFALVLATNFLVCTTNSCKGNIVIFTTICVLELQKHLVVSYIYRKIWFSFLITSIIFFSHWVLTLNLTTVTYLLTAKPVLYPRIQATVVGLSHSRS